MLAVWQDGTMTLQLKVIFLPGPLNKLQPSSPALCRPQPHPAQPIFLARPCRLATGYVWRRGNKCSRSSGGSEDSGPLSSWSASGGGPGQWQCAIAKSECCRSPSAGCCLDSAAYFPTETKLKKKLAPCLSLRNCIQFIATASSLQPSTLSGTSQGSRGSP